ncbi:conserved hypothetical protein [Coccidioides posadasii str. Silveira]|uniref:Uncharacterized protein n=2 Tax=Coccidioides posadasii TaxID=199306 RepID=E9CUC2_COCPS|nr:conserved hypothetical protein [Coccidioides posadasii str. Silveira]KMM67106.1 hypothetical protein CPAG_03442 [Coccidioides posadasii RMSCC 3488]
METGQEDTLERAPGTSQLLLGSRRASQRVEFPCQHPGCSTERCILPPRCATSGTRASKTSTCCDGEWNFFPGVNTLSRDALHVQGWCGLWRTSGRHMRSIEPHPMGFATFLIYAESIRGSAPPAQHKEPSAQQEFPRKS